MGLWSVPYNWTADEDIGAYLMNRYVRDEFKYLYYRAHPQRAVLWHDEALVTVGNALTTTVQSAQYYCCYAYQNASANGDTWTNSVYLAEGIYQVDGWCVRTSDTGKIDLSIGDYDLVVAHDLYTAVWAARQYLSKSPGSWVIAVPTSGRYVVTCTINGKNAASGGYDLMLTNIYFMPLSATGGDY